MCVASIDETRGVMTAVPDARSLSSRTSSSRKRAGVAPARTSSARRSAGEASGGVFAMTTHAAASRPARVAAVRARKRTIVPGGVSAAQESSRHSVPAAGSAQPSSTWR